MGICSLAASMRIMSRLRRDDGYVGKIFLEAKCTDSDSMRPRSGMCRFVIGTVLVRYHLSNICLASRNTALEKISVQLKLHTDDGFLF